MTNQVFYENLKLRKSIGEKLDFEKITYDELKQLWWDETFPDSLIGELYDVTKETVRKKRYKLNVTKDEMLLQDMVYKYIEV